MLQELRISNLALIERAEVHCGPGLNVLTGETGAGKSILIQALGLLCGARAASEQIGTATANGSAARAMVEGAFDLAGDPTTLAFLRAQDIDCEDGQLIIVREIAADGRSRIRLNGRLVPAATLREFGELLIDVHGQHEHQLLFSKETHAGFLDAFGGEKHQDLRARTRQLFTEWQRARQRLQQLAGEEQQRAQRLDMLQFQAEEIDATGPQPGEDGQLQDERARLANAEKLRDAASVCRNALTGERGAVVLLGEALKAARALQDVDSSVTTWVDELQSALYEIEDAAAEARAYAETLEADPLRLDEIEARLHRLGRLKRKYGETLEQVLEYRAAIQDEIDGLSLSDAQLAELTATCEKLRGDYLKAAEQLTKSRQTLARAYEKQVVLHLKSLALERARFEVRMERDEAGSDDGMDRIEFLFSANPGQPLRPLARIASGGEISRVMLALRTTLISGEGRAESPPGRVPIVVFDEIDAGIGGVTAEAVGEKMQELARHFQVFCVTHLPQIARRADHHLRVLKETGEAETRVSVTLLAGEARVRELARMMGRESEANLRHARELLKTA